MVELALTLPLFLLLLFGILDLGRAVYAFNTINNAARQGGRVAIVDQTVAHIQSESVQHAVSLAVAAADVEVDFRLPTTPETPDSCVNAEGEDLVGTQGVIGCLAVVRLTYDYTAATPLIGQLVGVISMVGETRFRVEAFCQEPQIASCPIGD